jgi:hypothetical protein
MEEFIMENIFKAVKEKYISDVAYTFDFASELLDKLNEKYPDAKPEGAPFFRNSGIRIQFMVNENIIIRIEYIPTMYSTGSPGLAISLETSHSRRRSTYSVYAKETPVDPPKYFQTIVTILMDRYEKVIDIYDDNDKYSAFESRAYELIDLVREMDSRLDKGGKEFKTITSADRRKFDDYLD